MKKNLSMVMIAILGLTACAMFTGCGGGSSETDPWVKAYDDAYIRTHDIFGNPR